MLCVEYRIAAIVSRYSRTELRQGKEGSDIVRNNLTPLTSTKSTAANFPAILQIPSQTVCPFKTPLRNHPLLKEYTTSSLSTKVLFRQFEK